jgi:predicted ATPase/DNA-binding XRE family transcriptional regulator
METPTSFGLWIRQRRKALDLTQEALAQCAGCSVSTIRKIETDERRPSREVAELLAGCLEIPVKQRQIFLKVARTELRVDQLASINSLAQTTIPQHLPPRPSSNLPIPPTPLLGREQELAAIAQLLQNAQCRLLTLTGLGGIGKTRLAIEAASRQREAFADGIYFVPLAPVQTGEHIIPAIAQAIGFSFYGSAELARQLLNYLQTKEMLLVLDNLEHILPSTNGGDEPGINLLSDLLNYAPGIKLLATSRERLYLHGEWIFEVHSLPIPSIVQMKGLETNSAIQLLLQTANRVQPASYTLTTNNRACCVRICQLTQGIPLGLELAATWMRFLSCEEIVQEIERNLDFLAIAVRDMPERHRSLRATFNYSWNLLSVEERRVMRQISLFRGGFRREAAEQVANTTLPLLSALVDKSLLQRTAAGRYQFHEFIQQYAHDYLQRDSEEYALTQERHSYYYLNLLQRREPALKSAGQKEVVAELTAEIDNIRRAWAWAVSHSKRAELTQAVRSLSWFYDLKGWLQEGVTVFGRAVEALAQSTQGGDAEENLVLWAEMLTRQGYFCFRSGQSELAKTLLQRSLAILSPLENETTLADTMMYLGMTAWVTGDYPEARRLLQESLALYQNYDAWSRAFCLGQIGAVAYTLGEYNEAKALLSQSLAAWRVVGDPRGIMFSLSFLGTVVLALNEYTLAQQLLRESLILASTIGDRWGIGTALSHLGLAAQAQGEYEEARYLFQESLTLSQEIGERWGTARALINLGNTTYVLGNSLEAENYFLDGLKLALEAQTLPLALDALVGLALLRLKAGAVEPALELSSHVLQHPASSEEARARALALQADLAAAGPPEVKQIESMRERVLARPFEIFVAEILQSRQ